MQTNVSEIRIKQVTKETGVLSKNEKQIELGCSDSQKSVKKKGAMPAKKMKKQIGFLSCVLSIF